MELMQSNGQENKEIVPRLVQLREIVRFSENPNFPTIIYVPPILGESHSEQWKAFSKTASRIMEVEINQYGYPNMGRYIDQTLKAISEQGIQMEYAIFVGFSEGCSLASRIGKALKLPAERIFLLGPIYSFAPLFKQRIKIFLEGRTNKQQSVQMHSLVSYLKKIYSAQDHLFSEANKKLSKLEQARLWNNVRKNLVSTQDDLRDVTIVSGKHDLVSPPRENSTNIIEGGHSFENLLRGVSF